MFLLVNTVGIRRSGPPGRVDVRQTEPDQPLTLALTNGKSSRDGDELVYIFLDKSKTPRISHNPHLTTRVYLN